MSYSFRGQLRQQNFSSERDKWIFQQLAKPENTCKFIFIFLLINYLVSKSDLDIRFLQLWQAGDIRAKGKPQNGHMRIPDNAITTVIVSDDLKSVTKDGVRLTTHINDKHYYRFQCSVVSGCNAAVLVSKHLTPGDNIAIITNDQHSHKLVTFSSFIIFLGF